MSPNTRDEQPDPSQIPDDPNTYEGKLYLSDFLRESTIRSAIQELQLPPGSRGLDAGCGIGSHTFLLAEAVGPEGHVTGLDLSSEFLAHAREKAESSNLPERIAFRQGNVSALPFDDDQFDWVWSVDCVGYATANPVALLKEMARVSRPGGILAILGWSSQQLLPGHPLLEARLNATSLGIAPFAPGTRPERHFLRALGWLRQAGLKEPGAKTFVGDVHAPLGGKVRSALISLLDMRWGEPQSELSPEDWEEYRRLSRPDSPDFILDLPDYYAFFTYSLFHGKVPR
jgi:demethylmenaquinone methyltransferase/2-methoxy-6-polyprenyl-1,4-benzoquinol methylase